MVSSAKRGGSDTPAGGDASRNENEAAASPGLDRVIQAQIGDKLRAMYGELVEQPVPDKLAALLEELSRQGRGR